MILKWMQGFLLPWVFTFCLFISHNGAYNGDVAECLLWLCALMLFTDSSRVLLYTPAFGIQKVWQDKQRKKKKQEREIKQCFAVISAQTWGKWVDEVRRLQIAQYYAFQYLPYFLTAVQLTCVPECCRSHMCGMKKCLLCLLKKAWFPALKKPPFTMEWRGYCIWQWPPDSYRSLAKTKPH